MELDGALAAAGLAAALGVAVVLVPDSAVEVDEAGVLLESLDDDDDSDVSDLPEVELVDLL